MRFKLLKIVTTLDLVDCYRDFNGWVIREMICPVDEWSLDNRMNLLRTKTAVLFWWIGIAFYPFSNWLTSFFPLMSVLHFSRLNNILNEFTLALPTIAFLFPFILSWQPTPFLRCLQLWLYLSSVLQLNLCPDLLRLCRPSKIHDWLLRTLPLKQLLSLFPVL